MAKVIQNEQYNTVQPWWGKGKSGIYGAAAGVVWWAVTSILNAYVIEPFACRDLATAASCTNSFATAGSIATVIVAVLFAYLLVRVLQPRPVVVTFATLLLLWDLGAYTTGLSWWAVLGWGVLLYVISYALFSLVAHLRVLWVSALLALFIVVALRLLLLL